MIFAAVLGPIPGSASSCSSVAALSETGPLDPELDPAPAAPRTGTTTCCPSASGAARFTPIRAARRVTPPAAATASATRDPVETLYRPGLRTAPTTSTTTRCGFAAAFRTGVYVRGGVLLPCPSSRIPSTTAATTAIATASRRRWARVSSMLSSLATEPLRDYGAFPATFDRRDRDEPR